MKSRNAAGLAALALLLAACASSGTPPPATPQSTSLAADRGRALAAIRCAGCHAIAGQVDSPRVGAPSFGQVRLRYNALSWPQVMREIAEGRHGEMPPIGLAQAEVDDLRAYIETLR